MQLFLDHNVPDSVGRVLQERGHDVILLREVLPLDSPDPVVAIVCEDMEAILVTADRDFRKRIAPRIPKGQKARFRKLSRITLECRPSKSAERVELFLDMVEAEHAIAQSNDADPPMRISIGTSYFRTDR